jgi:hypothetical protein
MIKIKTLEVMMDNAFETMTTWDYEHMTADQKREELKYLIKNHIKNIESAQGREQTSSRANRVARWIRELSAMKNVLSNMADDYYERMNDTRFNATPQSRIDYYTQEA